MDEAQATLAGITAGASRTFKRHALWETDQAIDSLEGIGPMDRFGVTREVQIARKEHADQYTTFIRSGRTAAAKRYLTDKEGEETDTNLGMKPYRLVTMCHAVTTGMATTHIFPHLVASSRSAFKL